MQQSSVPSRTAVRGVTASSQTDPEHAKFRSGVLRGYPDRYFSLPRFLQSEGPRRIALIFRERLLAPSETFIREQAKPLRNYQPLLVGLRRTSPSLQHSFPQILLRNGESPFDKLAACVFRKAPIAPNFYDRLRSVNPSVIHAHFAIDAVQALSIAERLDLPLIVSLHGFDVTSTEQALNRTFAGRHFLKHRQRLLNRAAAFICVSRFLRQTALDAGFPESRLHVHYTGIDCERFRDLELERDPGLVLFVGRLVEVKGCEYLLRAMVQVQRQNPRAHLEVIGDGPLRASLEKLARELLVRVTFRGTQTPEEVMRSMSRARILCNPSVKASTGDMEGFGMVFAEAQALGTPVVSFIHGAIPEVVEHGATGLLCQERDVRGLSESIGRLLNDHALWKQMSKRSSVWVRERFDITGQTEKLEALYDECIAQHRSRSIQIAT